MRIVKAAPVMAKVRDDIDQVFDRLFRTTLAPEALFRTPAPAPEAWLPPFDLLETATEYVVRLDVPGAHRENLDISLAGTLLTLIVVPVIYALLDDLGAFVTRLFRRRAPEVAAEEVRP
ncbi:MAG TPA: hypothetical protein P5319_11405 [Gemmatimonadales bacterium]|nr:hypothetical protein [Gemmatimonadales bacterium]